MKLNLNDIKGHYQFYEYSCVPMSVECVLKLLKLMQISDFSLQHDRSKSWGSNWIPPSFPYPPNKPNIEFKREFFPQDIGLQDRGSEFMERYFEQLFETIDDELSNNRYVIISLESGPMTWHMEIVFDKNQDNTYKTITFYYDPNIYKIYESQDLRQRVTNMGGTDILTYKWI